MVFLSTPASMDSDSQPEHALYEPNPTSTVEIQAMEGVGVHPRPRGFNCCGQIHRQAFVK